MERERLQAGGTGRPKWVRADGRTGDEVRVKVGGRFWNQDAEDGFFNHLAATCNVTKAAEAVGFTTHTVYDHRRRRPEFAARWQAALEQGYARLEMALLAAANDSLVEPAFDAEHPIPRMTVEQAIGLLRAHRLAATGQGAWNGGRRARPRPFDEVRANVLRKVNAILAAGPERPAEEAAVPSSDQSDSAYDAGSRDADARDG